MGAPEGAGDSPGAASADADAGGYEGNGSHESAPPVERELAPAPAREFHAEPRESSSQTHLPLAHFEPAPRVEPAGESKPYVVWSSAPVDKVPPNRDQE